ncbi:uncharacterized protein UV8b_04453 [Ustilaginoidea virens]|uniref:Leucine carboxyl methyltransferase 1 n=1 Tax=Ustilaginoidea virens TaxID=1159556 RepID=A0A1B5L0S8_USTVR|nr:uncharacterized protein UV8b_04453 [Ustilaginoidea virens]QUC20212.1 hypothetical protein UV8b_04453 [Ustilaginoidea virens]GAO16003.1 hypothetical protein UVI_02055820 [Ustilaginoidea virens]
MAAPSIPNLLSLKDGGRGRGRGRRPAGPPDSSCPGVSPDVAVQGTDTDAAVSRLSAVDLGYLDDPYARLFVSGPPTRRLPIINRGTYMRTTCLDAMIAAFLCHNGARPKQIISLGAGSDTRPLRLLQKPGAQTIVYHEVDLEPTCRRKLAAAQSCPSLRQIFKDHSIRDDGGGGGSWSAEPRWGGEYRCHALDLRDLAKTTASLPRGMRADLPTLVLSECCLCYLGARESEDVLRFFSARIGDLAALLYEPMPLDDAFGAMMMANLKARHIYMPSLDKYRNQRGQLARLEQSGFESVGCATIDKAWDEWVDKSERERVDGLEGLDEVEEWKLLAAHYLVVWGARGVTFGSLGDRTM